MSAYRELAEPRPLLAWVSWGGSLLALLALLMGATGALLTPPNSAGAAGQPWRHPPRRRARPRPRGRRNARAVLAEVGKQAVEQPLHFLIAAAPICLSRQLAGVPWYGWAITPLLAWREWSQWPSRRWWDPPLDWAFLTLGVVSATSGAARAGLRPVGLRRRPGRRASPCAGNIRAGRRATASIRPSANG